MGTFANKALYFQFVVVLLCSNLMESSPTGQNDRSFADDIFKCIFYEWEILYFDSSLTEVCS